MTDDQMFKTAVFAPLAVAGAVLVLVGIHANSPAGKREAARRVEVQRVNNTYAASLKLIKVCGKGNYLFKDPTGRTWLSPWYEVRGDWLDSIVEVPADACG